MSLRFILCFLMATSFMADAREGVFSKIFKKKKTDNTRQHISGEYLDQNSPESLPSQEAYAEVPVTAPIEEYNYQNSAVATPTEQAPPKKQNLFQRLFNRSGKTREKRGWFRRKKEQEGPAMPQNSEWSSRDEEVYSRWILAIGESGCNTPTSCLNSSANFLRKPDEDFSVYAEVDCARLPYLLRGYFAQKMGLPFASTSDVVPLGPLTDVDDAIRYTPAGNGVQGRRWITAGDPDAKQKLIDNIAHTTTKVLRVPSDRDDNDFYPIEVDKANITPGTVYYDASGHAGIVYKVDENGYIHMLNAHPGSSISRKVFDSENYTSSASVASGGGFKKFRPIVVDNGRYRLASNTEIPDYSLEQYSHGSSSYFDYVKENIGTQYDPLINFDLKIREVCSKFKERNQLVEKARVAGLPGQSIDKLPNNIYGGAIDWETHSTPSADLRINTSLASLSSLVKQDLSNDPSIKKSLRDIFTKYENSSQCRFSYTNSQGTQVQLGLRDLFNRAFKISFDPYQCPELRMGAPSGSAERATCSDPLEIRWYNAQSTLRNRTDKDPSLATGFSLSDLEAGAKNGLGPANPPAVDLLKTLF